MSDERSDEPDEGYEPGEEPGYELGYELGEEPGYELGEEIDDEAEWSDDESDEWSEDKLGVMLDDDLLQIIDPGPKRAPGVSELYLGLPCAVRDTDLLAGEGRMDLSCFIADIFGVSHVNEDGCLRLFGYWWLGDASLRAVFWQVDLWCMTDLDLTVYSDYHVTLLSCEQYDDGSHSTTYILHPGPVARLADCKLYLRPRWWIGSASGDAINVSTSEHRWSDTDDVNTETYSANIEGWSPFGTLVVSKN